MDGPSDTAFFDAQEEERSYQRRSEMDQESMLFQRVSDSPDHFQNAMDEEYGDKQDEVIDLFDDGG